MIIENPADETSIYFISSTKTFYYYDGLNYLPVTGTYPSGALTNDITSGAGWDASTNVPTIVSSTGNEGDFAIVAVAGTTTIDGISSWVENDIIWYDADNFVWRKIDNQIEQVTNWESSKLRSGVYEQRVACFDELNNPELCETQISAMTVGDYTTNFPDLAVASNWMNNIASLTGTLGDRAIGTDELGSISESFYTQYGWARDFVNPFITNATLIAALVTSGNWTFVSDVISSYNASSGDRGQVYYNNGILYYCIGNAAHTWIRYGPQNTVTSTDINYLRALQVEVGKVDNDTFTQPATYELETAIYAVAETTTAGNISIGTSDGATDVVGSTALPTTIDEKVRLTVTTPDATSTDRTLYINIDSAASVKLEIIIKKMFE